MEVKKKDGGPGPYLASILACPVKNLKKRRITAAIAEAWEIPEVKVLASTEIIDKVHPSAHSAKGVRVKVPGERKVDYVNARKFYFYVMIEIKKYRWRELTKITGRKIAAMKYANSMAKIHLQNEEEFRRKAQSILDQIAKDQILFPEPIITFSAKDSVIDRNGLSHFKQI